MAGPGRKEAAPGELVGDQESYAAGPDIRDAAPAVN